MRFFVRSFKRQHRVPGLAGRPRRRGRRWTRAKSSGPSTRSCFTTTTSTGARQRRESVKLGWRARTGPQHRPRAELSSSSSDSIPRREYVVQVLLKVIDSMQVDDAVNVMQEAHESGIALVTGEGREGTWAKTPPCPRCVAFPRTRGLAFPAAVVQEDAERYCQGLRNGGLISTIEPDTAPGGSN